MSPPLSPARRAGGLLFVSGQLGRGPDGAIVPGGIRAQARQAIANLRRVLEAEGSSLSQVVKTNVWLTDPADMAEFNLAYREAFGEPYPARSAVVSGLFAEGARVEMEAVAAIG
jgi:2-iminobutanoate/2-iminopropanoate deaminase